MSLFDSTIVIIEWILHFILVICMCLIIGSNILEPIWIKFFKFRYIWNNGYCRKCKILFYTDYYSDHFTFTCIKCDTIYIRYNKDLPEDHDFNQRFWRIK